MPKAFPRTTFAVFLATPGSSSSSSIVEGTTPPCFAVTMDIAPCTDFALFRQKLSVRTCVSIAAGEAAA